MYNIATTNVPTRAHTEDAGYDLVYAGEEITLEPGQRQLLDTTIASIAFPPNTAGIIASRSGLAHRHGIIVLNSPGIVDPGYRGRIKVNLYNAGTESYTVTPQQRIAQLLFMEVLHPEFTVVDINDPQLSPIDERTGGHGSSGTH